jgi:hypothetical protein
MGNNIKSIRRVFLTGYPAFDRLELNRIQILRSVPAVNQLINKNGPVV